MAATLYYMLVRKSDDKILAVAPADIYSLSLISENEVNSATFSANAGDSPDVVTAAGQPVDGGTYVDETQTYTAPVKACLKAEWDGGDGSVNADGIYELTANGTNEAILKLTKWDQVAQAALDGSAGLGEEYYLGPNSIGLPLAIAQLNNGTTSVTLTPPNGEKGLVAINIFAKGSVTVYPKGQLFICLL